MTTESPTTCGAAVRSSDLLGFPPVLDACCGKRAMWFDPQDSRAIFVDKRRETLTVDMRPGRKPWVINPDVVADFTALPFPDNTFRVVAFDPPHASFGETSYMAQYYGTLKGEWREMLRKGFAECFRVLKPEGVLIFKWNETQVPIGEILKLTPEKPMFGQKTGRATGTHWVTFLKPNDRTELPPPDTTVASKKNVQ